MEPPDSAVFAPQHVVAGAHDVVEPVAAVEPVAVPVVGPTPAASATEVAEHAVDDVSDFSFSLRAVVTSASECWHHYRPQMWVQSDTKFLPGASPFEAVY